MNADSRHALRPGKGNSREAKPQGVREAKKEYEVRQIERQREPILMQGASSWLGR
jgi:hypothetical protein